MNRTSEESTARALKEQCKGMCEGSIPREVLEDYRDRNRNAVVPDNGCTMRTRRSVAARRSEDQRSIIEISFVSGDNVLI